MYLRQVFVVHFLIKKDKCFCLSVTIVALVKIGIEKCGIMESENVWLDVTLSGIMEIQNDRNYPKSEFIQNLDFEFQNQDF